MPNIQIAANATVGSLIVRGTADELQLVSEIIDSWKQASANGTVKLRSFPLDRPATTAWLTTSEKLFPMRPFGWMKMARKLTVLSSLDDLQKLESNLTSLIDQIPNRRSVYYASMHFQKHN